MGVAGLQSVSVLDSTFNRESQSQLSRQWGNHDGPSTRASSLLQMWREIEGEHVMSHSQVRVGDRRQPSIDVSNADLSNPYLLEKQDSNSGHDDENSSSSELSPDFGDAERGRVRQIFQEWMNSGMRGHESNVYPVNNYSRGRMTSQQREEQAPEIGDQIERGHDGYVANSCEIGARRNLRKLCGRQALLDLLARAESERQRELQYLLECRPVSEFAHRNRIQTLLRGRFLQSGRLVLDERPSSMPPSELGLLRQQHTVSGIREGFLARLENFHGQSTHAESDTSYSNDINDFMNVQTQTNSLLEDVDAIQEQSQPIDGEGDINQLPTVPSEGNAGQDTNCQEIPPVPSEGNAGQDTNYQEIPTVPSEGNAGQDTNCQETNTTEEQQVGFSGNEDSQELQSSNSTVVEIRDGLGGNTGENSVVSIGNVWSQETSGNEIEQQCFPLRDREIFHEQNSHSSGERDTYALSNHVHVDGIYAIEDMNGPNTSAQVEQGPEPVTDNEDNDSRQPDNEDNDSRQPDNLGFSGWRDDNAEGTEGNWSEGTARQWYQEMLGTEGEELDHMQDLDEQWHESGPQDAMDVFLEGPSPLQATPVGRLETSSYFPDDDNVYSSEIRELLSRRSVSNLLQSDFRESLDQLIQSYAERQTHASVDWEMDEPSPSLREVERNVQQSGGQNLGLSGVSEMAPVISPSPAVGPYQPFWDLELQEDNWVRNNMQQRLGIEWEIINDLRIDMARLQQRMDNMQRMLEACMDMQIELQRSVQQEVSAALNRSASSTDCDNSLQEDESKWEHLRKGLCCICCDNTIDSLLYRCGHMCTCSKCADKLVQGKGKCPMCRAPVVEMIRAYSIQ